MHHGISLNNSTATVAAGDTISINNDTALYFMIAALGADVTVSVQLISGGSYRDLDLVITADTVKTTSHKIPKGLNLKFSAAAEVKVYNA